MKKCHLFVIIFLINLAVLVCQQNNNLIFSPFPIQTYDLTSQYGTTVTIKIAFQANLIAVACGIAGVILIDGNTQNIIQQQEFVGESIEGLAITNDGKYIMLSHQNQFTVYELMKVQNTYNFVLLSSTPYTKGYMKDAILDKTETIAFAYGTQGTLIAYNITNKNSPQQIGGYFSNSAEVRRAVIANDNSFLFLADDINGRLIVYNFYFLLLIDSKKNAYSTQLFSVELQVPDFELIVATTGGQTWWQSWALAVTSDNRYAYVCDNWAGIYISDLSNVYNTDPALYPAFFWPYPSYSVYSAHITMNNNFLLIGHRSHGVEIIDISTKLAPVHYMTVPCEAQGFDVKLSADETILYYANAKSIVIFISSIPNLNNDYPNLHNFQQSDIDQFSNTSYLWRCSVSDDDKYFYGFFDVDGVYIMDYTKDPYHMQFQSRVMPPQAGMSIDIAVVNNENYLYVGAGQSPYVAYVYDITDKTNPIALQEVAFNGAVDADGLYISYDKKYLAQCNYSCVILYDITNPKVLNQIFAWYPPPTIFGSIKDICMSKDSNYVVGSVRSWGYFVLDIHTKTSPVLKQVLQTSGAEGMVVSLNQQYLYCFDGFRGLLILDISNLPTLTVVSQLQLTGWANFIQPMYNDAYLLVDDYENGQLSLVDITDLHNPILVSTYDSGREAALGVCTTLDSSYGFIITNMGVRTIPLKSDITIHTQISEVITQSVGQPQLQTLSASQNLLVGQTIQFNFLIIRPPLLTMEIQKVYYYDNYEMKLLPYWMDYSSSGQSLTINVVKDGLGLNYTIPHLNTVIIQTAVPITNTSFIYKDSLTNLVTTPAQANLIYNYLISNYLLDSNNFVTSFFDHNEPFSFNINGLQVSNMNRLFQLVKLTLMKGTYYNPIQFYIAPSLSLDVTNKTSPIQTTSSQITLTMLVDTTTGQFVIQTVQGVIISYTDSQNQVKLEGLLDNVNQVLASKIHFSLNANATHHSCTITVEDGVNNNAVQTKDITKIPFVALNIPTTKGQDIQPQVNAQYSGGDLPIEADISISIAKNSFVDPDSPVLTYTLQVLQGNQYQTISSDFFLSLSTDLKLTGKTIDSQYDNTYYLRISASDGYSVAYNYFSLTVNILPFTFVFNLLVKIFGPIIGVFGVYKYKSDILNIFFDKKTVYSSETAIVNNLYRKQIAIMGNDLDRARELYKEFKHKLLLKENLAPLEEREKRMYFHQDSANTIKDEDMNKQVSRDQDVFSLTRRTKCLTTDDENLKKAVYALQMAPSHKAGSLIEKLYLRKDGSIAMTRIFRDMLQLEVSYTLNAKTYAVKNDIKEFQNKDSRFFKCLQGIVARDFIKEDFKANIIYDYMKYYAKEYFTYTHNDWYKVYVDIKATDRNDKYNQQVPFPDLFLKDEMVNRVLMDLNLNNEKGQTLDNIQKLGINSHLIRMNLFSDTLGITQESPNFLSPCVGESLHLQFFEVHSVEAFKHVKDAWCMKLRKLIGMDYMSFGMSKNMTLPHWLQFDIKNGVLLLEGIPAATDIDQLLIRVYDESLYIVQHFFLNIADEYNAEVDNFNEELQQQQQFDNSNVLIQNDSVDNLNNSKMRVSVKEKNQQKISQFKWNQQNSCRLQEQESQLDKSTLMNKNQQSPQLTDIQMNKTDIYVDEIFSIQNKDLGYENTTNRQILEKDMSSMSQRNAQIEMVDKSLLDGDASFTRMQQQMDIHNQQQNDLSDVQITPNVEFQGIADKNSAYFS